MHGANSEDVEAQEHQDLHQPRLRGPIAKHNVLVLVRDAGVVHEAGEIAKIDGESVDVLGQCGPIAIAGKLRSESVLW